MVSLDQAAEFMWLNARLVDQLRFEYHFRGGERDRVVDGLRPYQNADGGIGNAFEPDLRGPASQPCSVDLALGVLDDIGAFDVDLIPRVLDYLVSITRPDGGVPWVLPTVLDAPHGPWWQVGEDPPGNLNPTAAIAGRMHKHGVKHDWVEAATQFCWHQLDELTSTFHHELVSITTFLAQVPDRARAEAVGEKIGRIIEDNALVAPEPQPEGEVLTALELAPRPDSFARRWFDDTVIAGQLDALAAAQQPDGGWQFNFESWTPITTPEWRGWVTLESLITLRANGRLQ